MALIDIALFLGITVAIYSLLAIGLNLQWGDTGLMNFAHAAFFGIGGYTTAILTTPVPESPIFERMIGFNLPIVVGLVAAFAIAAIVGVLLALTSLRLREDYLAMVTLAAGEIIHTILANESWLTSGVRGLSGIQPLITVERTRTFDIVFLAVATLAVALAYLAFKHLADSSFGRVLHAIREDEKVPQALGKNTAAFKLKSFALGAGIAGFAGGLWAHYLGHLSPNVFPVTLTFLIWTAVIVGGSGNYMGVVVGTLLIMTTYQVTRFIPSDLPFATQLPYLRMVLIGTVLILVMYYRPYGLLGDRERMRAGQEVE